ncbi:MAG TPA: DUF3313 family protein [Myxococcota bacterium]|nr:DUF3313 family protein [Myxococcota bacterium]
MKRGLAGCLLAALVLAAAPGTRSLADASQEVSHDGLVRVEKAKRFQAVWLKPGASLQGYTKLLVLPAEIHYKRPPNKSSMARENFALSDKQMERLERAMREVVDEEIVAKGGWEIATEPGPDVLVVHGGLIDLVVNIPPNPAPGRGTTFVASFGEATLVVELYDSQTMEILARVADRQEAEPIGGRMQSVDISAAPDVKHLLRRWAKRLREGLEDAKSSEFPV